MAFSLYREKHLCVLCLGEIKEKKKKTMETEDAENRLPKNRGENRYPVYERTDSRWTSWLIPLFIIVSIVVFVVEMYINNCPKHIDDLSFYGDSSNRKCVARFLGRFSFQPLSENPSFGPSAST